MDAGARADMDVPRGYRPVRTRHSTAQDRHSMTEHDDLDRQFISFAPTQLEQLEHPCEGQVDEGQCHGPSSPQLSLGERPG